MQEGHTDSPFCLPESRKLISHMKDTLPASGGRRTPLSLEIWNSGQEACINKPYLLYYPKPKLRILHWLSTQSLNFFVLTIPRKFIVSLSKKYISCLLWSLLRFHFYETLCAQIKICLFFSCYSVLCQFHYESRHKNSRGVEREVFPSLTINFTYL